MAKTKEKTATETNEVTVLAKTVVVQNTVGMRRIETSDLGKIDFHSGNNVVPASLWDKIKKDKIGAELIKSKVLVEQKANNK